LSTSMIGAPSSMGFSEFLELALFKIMEPEPMLRIRFLFDPWIRDG
jgi:hypothetical protein